MNLSIEEKKILLETARNSINNLFNPAWEFPISIIDEHPILESKAGAFVTITKNYNLRGCIGFVVSENPLYKTIQSAAVQAATADPRFPALNVNELDDIELEVSILSEPFQLRNYDEIRVGKHGLILEEGLNRGLLLPQVPIEHNLNRDQYLSALCQKAGMHPYYWTEKQLKLKAFTATVFSEREIRKDDYEKN